MNTSFFVYLNMTDFFCIIISLLVTHIAMCQDSIIVEHWEDNKPKKVEYYRENNSKKVKVKESLFYTDGKLWEERIYDTPAKTAVLIRYDTKGNEELSIPLNERGYMDGLYIKKYPNGQKAQEGIYSDGKRKDLWKYWYESGKLEKEIIFKEGCAETEIEWWENGNKRREKDRRGTITHYHENGNKRSLMTNCRNYKLYTYWDDNGTKRKESKITDNETLIINAWTRDGKRTVAKGNGYVDIIDGELGIPMRINYKEGRVEQSK
jgi:antitoxin component YwqK of YwqJK toxin-antitoxin module